MSKYFLWLTYLSIQQRREVIQIFFAGEKCQDFVWDELSKQNCDVSKNSILSVTLSFESLPIEYGIIRAKKLNLIEEIGIRQAMFASFCQS